MIQRTIFILFFFLTLPFSAFASQKDERAQAYYHFMLGSMKELSRDYPEAIKEYREALKYDPDSSEIFSKLASLYVQTNRMNEAIHDAQKAIEKNADNKEAHRMLGQIFMERMYLDVKNEEDLRRAVSEFEEVRRIDPNDYSAVLTLGQLYLQNNQPQSAEEMFSKYLEVYPDSSTAVLSLASAYQQLNQIEKAITYLLKYLETKPDNVYVVQQVADLYEKAGQHHEALQFRKKVYEADPKNPANIRKYVDVLEKNQIYQDAIEILESQVKENPDKLQWSVLLAKSVQKSGNQERAESLMKEIITKKPEDLDSRLAMVQIYEEAGKYQDAIQQLTEMMQMVNSDQKMEERERKSNLALIYSHLGYAKQQLQDYQSSINYYRQARQFVESEDVSKIDFYVALNYRSQKKWDEAIDTLNSILKEDPNDTDSWELLSLIYEEKGDAENSDKIIKHLIDTHANDPRYYLLKGERLQQREQYAESITYLKDLIRKFPKNDQIRFLIGAACERLKKTDEAEEYFKQTIILNPRNANALNYLGYMLIDRGVRLEESIEYIKRALEIDRDNGAYLDSLGWGYFKLNKLDLAEDNLRMALEKLSDNAVVHDHLGDLHFRLGKFREAIRHWETALENKNNEIDPQYIRKKIDDTKNRLQ